LKLVIKGRFCTMHKSRLHRTGQLERRIRKGFHVREDGYVQIWINGERVYEHIHLAEKALGKKLPAKAIVHHMNEKAGDNHTPFNLVICPDQAYHKLLHKRAREYRIRTKFPSLWRD